MHSLFKIKLPLHLVQIDLLSPSFALFALLTSIVFLSFPVFLFYCLFLVSVNSLSFVRLSCGFSVRELNSTAPIFGSLSLDICSKPVILISLNFRYEYWDNKVFLPVLSSYMSPTSVYTLERPASVYISISKRMCTFLLALIFSKLHTCSSINATLGN